MKSKYFGLYDEDLGLFMSLMSFFYDFYFIFVIKK